MTTENNCKTKFIKQFVIDNDLWQTPSRTLAKMVLAANPKIFGEYNDENIDSARSLIRYLRHTFGTNKSELNQLFADKFAGFMEPDQSEYTPFVIPETVTKLGIICDVHFPFQHKQNLESALQFLETKEIDGLLLNGDIIDCYKGSSFLQDPRQRNLFDEMNILREFIDTLNSRFNCPIFYKTGNHEERIELSVLRQVPELVHFITFENCLSDTGKFDFDEYKLTVIKDKRIVKFTSHLSILHGHEYRGGLGSPVGIARWLYLKARSNAATAHFHKKDSFSARTIEQHTIETHSIGCLSEMNPKYMPLNDWQSGFAFVRRIERDNYRFSNHLIENGKVL